MFFYISDSSLFCVHCNQNFANKRQIQEHCREFHKVKYIYFLTPVLVHADEF